jgi:hypothetical protein
MTAHSPSSNRLRDRRKYLRKTPARTVKVEFRRRSFASGERLAVQVLNISEGGLCIVVPEAVPSKEELEVSILRASQSKPITCLAKVCWSVPMDDGTFCAGLKFRKKLLFEEVLQIASQARALRSKKAR